MRVKYQTRTITTPVSDSTWVTEEEYESFFTAIINALADMGAPLNLDDIEHEGGISAVSLIGSKFNVLGGGSGLWFYGYSGRGKYYFEFGCNGESPDFENYFYTADVNIGTDNNNQLAVTIHAVKSGDSFFFGFIPAVWNQNGACISLAITPMRRLSDPTADLGYAIVSSTSVFNVGTYEEVGEIEKTLPYIEGFSYYDGWYNYFNALRVNAFPEVDTGKIPMIPLYAGVEDIYYENVYISPMRRGPDEEKAFETDKGVFLICGSVHTDDNGNLINLEAQTELCQLAFDITEVAQ